ncbi:S1C family serine protease [Corynebacterium terpenotabidum]|uniref:Trypsin-like serine protease n=1 Tax=Corynebacterium terpenotabidum Y-11 TaxID=1200352 RepID=S4XFE8_9CORY|nr:trypsin-like peptidase domain-containing protein [Corynebacterium terpenotabidum]AGP31304.1 trypsin-like serine protease [Corynebacterium terpenotabidum Y-11]
MSGNGDDNRNAGRWGEDPGRPASSPQFGPANPAQADPAQTGAQSFPGYSGYSSYPGQPGYAGTADQPVEDPEGQGGEGQVAVAAGVKEPRRFSTPAVAGMMVAVGVAASLLTGLIVNSAGSDSSSGTTFSTTVIGDREQASATPEEGTVEAVAQKVLPSVVSIQVTSGQTASEGSGSLISSDGLILTNNHVVSDAGSGASITVTTNDGAQYDATVVATDPQTDIAVIQAVGASGLTPITIGDPDALQVGQSVVAIGSPLGLSSTVTSGIVSAKDRPVQAGGESGGEASLIDAIQTDAAINPGNSGGALVNLNGELVGIPSVIATLGGTSGESGSIGLGFAIPADQAMETAQQLIDNGKASHPVIGAQVDTRETTTVGAVIAEVTAGGPAEEAGLKAGDVVTKVDDRVVDSGVSLIAAIRSHTVGDEVTLTVTDSNGDNQHEIKVTLSASE